MPAAASHIVPWAKALSLLLGTGVIVMAATTAVTGMTFDAVVNWSEKIFGGLFVTVLIGLLYCALLALTKVYGRCASEPGVRTWFETGVQSANAIATLALTYTLLGISLGIGSLSGYELNPQTIPRVIQGLTEHFSMAFMTTVIGLPVSAVLRAVLLVCYSHAEERAAPPSGQFRPGAQGE